MVTARFNLHASLHGLQDGTPQQQLRAALDLRTVAGSAQHKCAMREGGAIQALLGMLEQPANTSVLVIALEALCFLAADDCIVQDVIRHSGGMHKVCVLLDSGPAAEATHRALLAVRILAEQEAGRMAIMHAGGIKHLVDLLEADADVEIAECAAAALGNLAAGSHRLKDAICQAGAIAPLVRVLRQHPHEVVAELAAAVLCNLCVQSPANRQAILSVGGLGPLLATLSSGQEILAHHVPCEAWFAAATHATPQAPVQGYCYIDPLHSHLCLALGPPQRRRRLVPSWFRPREGKASIPATGDASDPGKVVGKEGMRVSMLRKLTITELAPHLLEISFETADKPGAPTAARPETHGSQRSRAMLCLQRVRLSQCSASETKSAIMRMLTRIRLELDFRGRPGMPAYRIASAPVNPLRPHDMHTRPPALQLIDAHAHNLLQPEA